MFGFFFFKQKTAYEMRISDWSSDVCSSDLWGNPITDKAAFELIRSYSPYDQVKAQNYPPILITGGLNDPRVTYWEPAKWAAKLRATKTDQNVLLLKTNMGAGHGGKSGRFDSLEEAAEEMAFILKPEGRRVGKEGVSTCKTR